MKNGWFQDSIVHIDDEFIVFNKPSGLPSVPGTTPKFTQNLYHLLLNEFPPVYVVHRLDINTSGLILFARTKTAQTALSIQFQKRLIEKKYRALLEGRLPFSLGDIELPIIADWHRRPLQKLSFDEGKKSITRVKRLQLLNDKTLVEFYPVTGRSHQLRIHAQQIGHPIVGCKLYGFGDEDSRLMLHAYELSFYHPQEQTKLRFTCPVNFVES